jgi:hypothetical protein
VARLGLDKPPYQTYAIAVKGRPGNEISNKPS